MIEFLSFSTQLIRRSWTRLLTVAFAIGVLLPLSSQAQLVPGGEFNFANEFFFANESESDGSPYAFPDLPSPWQRSVVGNVITVTRTGWPAGRVLVDYSTIDTNNVPRTDATNNPNAITTWEYEPTQGTLVFDDFEMSKSFVVPTHFLGVPKMLPGARPFFVQIYNPRAADEEEFFNPGLIVPTIGSVSNAAVAILHYGAGWVNIQGTNRTIVTTNFNIERTFYAVDERAPGSMTFDVILTGNGGNPGGDVIVHVDGIDTLPGPYFLKPASDYGTVLDHFNAPNSPYTDGTTNYPVRADATGFALRVTFPPNGSRRTITLPIIDDNLVEFNEDLLIWLERVPNNPPLGANNAALVTILYDEQPAGAGDRDWNPDFDLSTTPRSNSKPGANNVVRAVAVQPNQKTLIGGDFTAYNSVPRNRIARINFDGSIDTSFVPGTGADEFISSIVNYSPFSGDAGKILIGGGFTSYNNLQRNGIARLNSNGSLDTSFNPGAGANGYVRAVALQADERVVIAGEFSVFNSAVRNTIARLNSNGSLDTSFNPGNGPDGPVWAVAVAADGKIYIGGDFLTVSGEFRPHLARLNSDGSLDTTFDPGGGPEGSVYALALQTNGRLLVGGAFDSFDFRYRKNLARVDTTGALDTTYDPGYGANDNVYTIVLQPDGKAMVGGRFTDFNGTRRIGLTRLFPNGTVDTSFLDTAYNQFAGVINTFNFESPNFINSIALQADGAVMIGGSFYQIGANQSTLNDAPGAPIPAFAGTDWNVWSRADKRIRYNVARLLGGYTYGPGNVSILYDQNTIDENAGILHLPLQRFDGNLGTLRSTVTSSNGVAIGSSDYEDLSSPVTWLAGVNTIPYPLGVSDQSEQRVDVTITDDTAVEGDELFGLKLVDPIGLINLGGEIVPLGGALGTTISSVTISDNDFNRGVLVFSSPLYTTNENKAFVRITVLRTNGATGNVSVHYYTQADTVIQTNSAIPGVDYTSVQGTLNFDSGVTSQSFNIPIIDDFTVEPDKFFSVVLTNASGGATIPPSYNPSASMWASVRIVDNDLPSGKATFLTFTNTVVYTTNEGAGYAVIPLERLGGSVGQLSVTVTATSGSGPAGAIAGVDFTGITNTVTWVHGDVSPKYVYVPIIDDFNVEGTETVNLRISNPSVVGALGAFTNALLTITDDDKYGSFSFSQANYDADERGTNIWITVVRQGGQGGTTNVTYTIANGSATSGVDYIAPASGTLTFGPGVTSTNFVITILNNTTTTTNGFTTVNLGLAGAALGATPTATLNIIDDEFYGDPAGSLDPTFNALTASDDAIKTLALQPDGKLLVAGSFRLFNRVSRTRVARIETDGSIDNSFDVRQGPNATVNAMLLQPDGRVLIGGQFTQIAGTNRNYIARLLPDGTLDNFFNPGAGADSPVQAIAYLTDGGVVIGGAFGAVNGVSRPGVAVLNSNGTLRATFNPGLGVAGTVYALAVQLDGKILVGGDFTDIEGFTSPNIARLNPNGTLDGTFAVGLGPNGPVRSILVQPDGSVLIGGSFTSVNGSARGRLARLSTTGGLDSLFLGAVEGGNGDVTSLALQFDGKLVVGGAFTKFNGVTRNRITRLNQNGKTDSSINFGLGADDLINGLAIQPDRKIVLVGRFTSYDGETREHIARIHGGSIAGPGSFQFSTPFYQVDETGGAAIITVLRRGGTASDVTVNYASAAGTATPNLDYTNVVGTLSFPEGEIIATFGVPVVADNLGEDPETVDLTLNSPSAGTIGDIPEATLLILSDDSGIGFSSPTYNVSEAVPGGQVLISVVRVGATNALAQVGYRTVANGTATAGIDYTPVSGILTFVPGQTLRTFTVPITDDTAIEATESFGLVLSNVASTATLTLTTATVNIIDNEFGPGVLAFASRGYSVDETNGSVTVVVNRTGGAAGVVSVDYTVIPTTASTNDVVVQSGTLNFVDGQTSNSITITILDDLLVEPTENFVVVLSNPTGGASIGSIGTTSVSILDSDVSQIVAAGTVLVSESSTNNGFIDPGETVTVALGLRNQGSGNTANLVGTLLTGNGVANPSGAQTYGVLVAGGGAVSQNFTFTAAGNSGDRILATLLLTDAGATNGFVTFGFTIGGQATRTFGSTNGIIQINDNDVASPYPSAIIVDNLGGLITKVTVTINNFTHSFPDDVDILLVGPGGQKVTLMSDVGGNVPASNVTLTFSDTATNILPDSGQLFSRTYLPTNYAGLGTADLFPLPAPGIPYTNSSLAILNGSVPNGLWSLFVVDDGLGDAGTISGWSLRIETTDPVSASANLALAAATPRTVVVGSEFPLAFTVTNRGPAVAQNIVVVNEMPAGLTFVRASTAIGAISQVGRTLRWNIGSLPQGSSTTVSLVARADSTGTLINQAGVAATQVDLNPGDNSTTVMTSVVGAPSLAISRLNGAVQVTWPGVSGFRVQAATKLAPADWTDVSGTPQTVGGSNVLILPADGTARFYRLRSE